MLNHLTKWQADICLLQETHATESETQKLKTPHFNQVFSSTYNPRKRGVSILINNRQPSIHNTTITDPEERYVIINASINSNNITIANIYGTHTDDPTLFHNFFSSLNSISNSTIIIGGDFNTVMNPILDKSNTRSNSRIWHSIETLQQYISDLGLSDSWRLKKPSSREYTYFSPVHQSCSRIDVFLTSNSTIPDISDLNIHPIIISDHAPVSFNLHNKQFKQPISRRRFNVSLLTDPDFNTYFTREWASFMEINDSPEISPSLLWETAKVVLRGKIISYSSHKKKKELELENNRNNKNLKN